ncbi:MAG: LacI family DNA-binding transcriptional regulator [bacterium]|nr:LacI family DNA-binding transcriptional regulator [bacterium]
MPKSQRPVTMRDVAKLAGVSQSTVSRILSQPASTSIPISDETYKRVYSAIEELGYQLNLAARSLRTQRTNMIAVMIADISNAFYHSITRTIQDIAAQRNYDVLIANTDHVYEYEKRFIQAMMRRPVDGVILVPYHLTFDEIDSFVERTGVAVAALARHLDHPLVDTVSADDGTATYEAVNWLIAQKGHRRIGFIGVSTAFMVGERRHQGYMRALAEAGLDAPPEYLERGDFTAESGARAMAALMALPEPPTAVFACNDIMAVGALNTALDLGLRVPQDVALVGFDNIPLAEQVRPRLTSVAQYPVDMGRELANLLFARIDGTTTQHQRLDIPCRLIERESA